MNIQEYLAELLEAETKTKSLFDIQKDCGVKTTSLSRLIKQKKASIKTCEALMTYFSKTVETTLKSQLLVRGITARIKSDDGLSDKAKEFLAKYVSTGFSFAVEL